MGGTSLAFKRRAASRLFTERVFVGDAIDIGCGDDPIRVCDEFPRLRSVREFDKMHGDASDMSSCEPESFDLVYSSHCLEHVAAYHSALGRWWTLVRPGGHLVIVVPDEETYEKGLWPSRFNPDHKSSFSTVTRWSPSTISHQAARLLLEDVQHLRPARIISYVRLEDGWIRDIVHDQTADASCECGIELVMRKERS